MKKITDAEFEDLYIGDDWAEVMGLDGDEQQVPVPREYADDIQQIRTQCFEIERESQAEEFSIRRANVLYRVTVFMNTDGKTVFIIRKPLATLMPFRKLGFGTSDMQFLLREELRGLVLFSGDMRSGKTTSAASLSAERVRLYGGTGIAIEDPPETPLDGQHGRGRIIQVEARGPSAYAAQVKKAMRSGAKLIYLGEIRDSDSAAQVVTASNNGNFILSTTHALSPKDAVMRVCNMCSSVLEQPEKVLASGLAAVIHLQLTTKAVNSVEGKILKKTVTYQMLRVEKNPIVQNVIRNREFHQLDNALEDQVAKQRSGSQS